MVTEMILWNMLKYPAAESDWCGFPRTEVKKKKREREKEKELFPLNQDRSEGLEG